MPNYSKTSFLPLMEPVKNEHQRMEREGIIANKAKSAIYWCTGLVVVPKPNHMHMCGLDSTQKYKSEVHDKNAISFYQSITHWHSWRSTIIHQTKCKLKILAVQSQIT